MLLGPCIKLSITNVRCVEIVGRTPSKWPRITFTTKKEYRQWQTIRWALNYFGDASARRTHAASKMKMKTGKWRCMVWGHCMRPGLPVDCDAAAYLRSMLRPVGGSRINWISTNVNEEPIARIARLEILFCLVDDNEWNRREVLW